jgi:hypothetical protein
VLAAAAADPHGSPFAAVEIGAAGNQQTAAPGQGDIPVDVVAGRTAVPGLQPVETQGDKDVEEPFQSLAVGSDEGGMGEDRLKNLLMLRI